MARGYAAYYNEFDPYAAAWLRNLIAAGLIAAGDVDERSITEVQADDVRGYTQCHWFAGVGGWSYALRLAGWGDDRPVWTGSCPCQPFSVAGKGLGESDHRHLWPEFRRLLSECRPATVAGEQVASADGRRWLGGVRADLESLGYRVGAADLCAAGVGAPHIRQRLYWVAYAEDADRGREPGGTRPPEQRRRGPASGSADGRLGDADDAGCREPRGAVAAEPKLACTAPAGAGADGLPDAERGPRGPEHECASGRRETVGAEHGAMPGEGGSGPWGDTWLPCLDGRWRRVEPGAAPLAHGVPRSVADLRARMGLVGCDPSTPNDALREARRYRKGSLRGYGNAIVPQVAAEFIRSYMDVREDG